MFLLIQSYKMRSSQLKHKPMYYLQINKRNYLKAFFINIKTK